ncbi:MAG TPA: hypothetical protein DCZ95_05315 [Verrucomicrobia bacterium]|nr:MAG: hypothetical protein A2X46_10385 [Lentisphaerae bacterium GWF2_57_35]HBA83497.1 hypothetical protein [Verrucomicrobiota bacterium]
MKQLQAKSSSRQREAQSELERHEAKYIIEPALVPQIREFISPFCIPDPNADGDPPEYTIVTLQLDSPTLTLHRAKELETVNRFKLRCRTYGMEGTAPVFLEIKRKIKGIIVKSRTVIPRELWEPDLFRTPVSEIPFKSRNQRMNFIEFRRLMHRLDARPTMLIRYVRESYLGRYDNYARLTFDRRLCYCPAQGWQLPPQGVRWRTMDSCTAQRRPYSGMILELKTYRDAPEWMVELTERFDLVRVGFCKYSTAMRLESLFSGAEYSDGAENTTMGLIMT